MKYVKPGDDLNIPAKDYNSFVDAAEDFKRRRLGGSTANEHLFFPPGGVVLKNTVSNLVQGRVLEIGTSLITTFDRRYPWFNGTAPTGSGNKGVAITLLPMATDDIWWCLASGVCHARVNIVHEQQRRAAAVNTSTLLQSAWVGQAEILAKESTGTGEKNCWIRIGEYFRGPLEVVLTGGIVPGGSGTAKVQQNGVDASPTSEILVHYKWMAGADDAQNGAEAIVYWSVDRQKFMIYELECPAA